MPPANPTTAPSLRPFEQRDHDRDEVQQLGADAQQAELREHRGLQQQRGDDDRGDRQDRGGSPSPLLPATVGPEHQHVLAARRSRRRGGRDGGLERVRRPARRARPGRSGCPAGSGPCWPLTS